MAMLKSTTLSRLIRHISQHSIRFRTASHMYTTMANNNNLGSTAQDNNPPNVIPTRNRDVGDNVPRKEKIGFLVRTLIDLKDNKEAVYGTLDAWVAWEQNFPIGPLKNAIITLEREQEWRRVIQVIKWMLSKGQGTTLNTYGQLIRALDMENRAEEAHEIWVKKIGDDLHSVPWQICNIMISVYYRNKMFERIVKLFQGLESFDRKPTEKSIIQKVADAYELLGLVDEKEKLLEKYSHLFSETYKGKSKFSKAKKERSKKKFYVPHSNGIGIALYRPLLTANKIESSQTSTESSSSSQSYQEYQVSASRK